MQTSDVVLVDVGGGGGKVLKHLVEIEFTPSKKLQMWKKMEANLSDCRFSLSLCVHLFTAQPALCVCVCVGVYLCVCGPDHSL